MNKQSRRSASGGSKAALDGFEYQIDVSVLTAMRLMLITKSATRITLEPANEEDLEVDLDPATPGRVQPSADMTEGYKLVVQVKLCNSGPWSIKGFEALLKHGTNRQPARCHLDDPGTRYLLITNADASGVARNLLVRGLEEWPEGKDFPADLSKTLPRDPEGRIAIWGVLTEPHLDLEVEKTLGSLLRVPQNRQEECRVRLREAVLRRMRGTSPGVWTREDLLSVIRDYGGYLASAPQLESFVPPANFEDLKDRLQRYNALVITGPSGTGKTWAARALIDQAKNRSSPPEIIEVNINDGPSSTRALTYTGSKLFYVEDPWGQYSLRSGADSWTGQLPQLLREAHSGHQYVVTSRTDLLTQAKANQKLERWTVVLDADHYRDGELEAIYDKHLESLAIDLQAKALDFRTDALNALETPLEVELFFSHMAGGPQPDEIGPAFFHRVLALAHRDAVEDEVVSYLGTSDCNGESAIIWALLAARSQFDRSQLVSINRPLRTVNSKFVDGLDKLVDRLVATRHLRQPSQTVSFSHPSVRAGFEMFIKQNWGRSEDALVSLILALTQLGGSRREWGLETAARSVKAITDFISGTDSPDVEFEVDSASHEAIDAWLEDGLIDPKADFRALLKLASDVGTQASIPSELARWFIKGIRRGGQVFLDDWQPPIFDDAWYARVSADSRSFTIADRFVREQLPRDRDSVGNGFANRLDRIAGGLTPAFVAAAHKLVAYGYDSNVGSVAAGAVRDLDSYEKVLDEALDVLADLNRFFEQEGKEKLRAIKDGECNAAEGEIYQMQMQDEGYAAGIFVATYVDRVRSLGQWWKLAEHSRQSELGSFWADEIRRSNGRVSVEELRAVIAVTESIGEEERAWNAASQHWNAALDTDLEERLLSNPGEDNLRDALVYCALMASPDTLERCLERSTATPANFVNLLVDMHGASRRITTEMHDRLLPLLLGSIPSAGKEIFQALPMKDKPPKPVGHQALSLLHEAAKKVPPSVLDKIVPVIIVSGSTPSAAIQRWLTETEDHKLAKAAAETAVRIEDEGLVWLALDHARADARVPALAYLANFPQHPLPQRLLELASDPGSRVRRCLVGILSGRPHSDHLDVLLRLIDDHWSDAEAFLDDPPSYPIAREAIIELRAYGSLSDDIGDALLRQAERTDDPSLGIVALNTAAECCGQAIRKRIWALSFIDQARWIRVDAINALIQAGLVESDILDEITAELLFKLAPHPAASASVLLAFHGQVDAVVDTMERIAHSTKRRALLLLGVYGLAERDREAAVKLLSLLESDHPARRLLDLAGDEQLPKSALDDLGDIRIQRAVLGWLDDKIAKD